MDKQITVRILGKQDCVTADSFLDAVENVVAILDGVDREIAKEVRPPTQWRITAMAMHSPPEITFTGTGSVIDVVLDGLSQIETTAKRPKFFNDMVMAKAKHLVGLLNNGIAGIELVSGKKTARPTQHVAANVDIVVGENPKFYASESVIDGRLEQLSVHGQHPEFCVYDPMTDEPVRCVFKEDSIREVVELITRRARVRVWGMTKYNAKHKAVSVDVEKFEVIPEQTDLPQMADLHRAKINITGGVDSTTFIREQRDGDQD